MQASLYNISAAHYMALAKAMDVDPVGGGHPHHLSVGAAAVERPVEHNPRTALCGAHS